VPENVGGANARNGPVGEMMLVPLSRAQNRSFLGDEPAHDHGRTVAANSWTSLFGYWSK
jgi:hypothetical protein